MSNWYDSIVQAIAGAIDAVFLKKSDVVDNLSSTSSSAPLSAKQGKVLNDLIGTAIQYINQ